MNCNCRWTEFFLALVVLVFVLWPTQIVPANVAWWLVVVAAALLLFHSLFHHMCGCGMCSESGKGKVRSRRKRR